MNVTQLREELANRFDLTLDEDDALLAECVKICRLFGLGADEFFYKWEAQTLDMSRRTALGAEASRPPFTLAAARELKDAIQREREKQAAAAARTGVLNALSAPRGRGRGAAGILGIGRLPTSHLGTPVKSEPGLATGLGSPLPARHKAVAGPSRVKFDGPPMTSDARNGRAYRYMYEKISSRSELLDDRIDEFVEIFQGAYAIDDFGDPAATTEEEVYVVGRIALETESAGVGAARLNEASIALESSRMNGSGARVPVRFAPDVRIRGGANGTGGLGLFPGEIVALRGRNGGGGWFQASELISPPPLKPTGFKADPGATPATLLIASGPFTADTDTLYQPWHQLVQKMRELKPAVILLIGPFIDDRHPKLRGGDVDKMPEDMFRSIFVEKLSAVLDLVPGAIALLVPSVRDMISDHAVLPQSELRSELVDDPRIHLLPNPTLFALNGRWFRVLALDVLFHIRKEEYVKRAAETDSTDISGDDPGTDSMAALCRHLLRQRSLYPIFPTPLELTHEVNLDVTHMDGLVLAVGDDPGPDVLVIPSRYKQFRKTVDGTTVINPSFLSKGTYATMELGATTGSAPMVEISKIDLGSGTKAE